MAPKKADTKPKKRETKQAEKAAVKKEAKSKSAPKGKKIIKFSINGFQVK